MADRDNVIKGLEKIAEFFKARGDMAVGDGRMLLLSWMRAAEDAIALLKAQEPRVMTYEEVVEHYSLPPVFSDDLGMQEDYLKDVEPLYFDFPTPDQWDLHWRGADQVNWYLKEWGAGYGKIWRVWTGKPTEEQRRETPWD